MYCPPQPGPVGQSVRPVDTECHCLTQCVVGQDDRPALYVEISSDYSNFSNLDNDSKFKVLVCPITAQACKKVNRFLYMQSKLAPKLTLGLFEYTLLSYPNLGTHIYFTSPTQSTIEQYVTPALRGLVASTRNQPNLCLN